ncbi:MAG: phosphotransferase family protein [Thermoanaerobaculia bacterium]|nr:phosphotransferase family protein [Thermoanaerobaculia bacterium]
MSESDNQNGSGNESWIDRARPIRAGEELDVRSLEDYLHDKLGGTLGRLTVDQFPSGYSNLTYLIRLGEHELVLRRPPFGNRVATAHDMGREFHVLSNLSKVYPPAPQPYLFCDDETVIGAPFYVMERRRGIALRRHLPEGLELSPVIARRLSEKLVDNLARLHTLDYQSAGLGDLGKPEGYVERQVHGWHDRYQKSQTDGWPAFDQAGAWLLDSIPSESGAGLVHNDYKYDNLLLDPDDLTHIVAVLDWEMCTVGDPLMDLGTTLAYWVEAGDPKAFRTEAFGPTAVPGSMTRRELAERYAEVTGADLGDLTFYVAFGLYKLGVIVQQIYWRYTQGLTQDERFAQLNQMVGLLGRMAVGMIERDKV